MSRVRGRQRGVLVIVTLLLVVSGLLRVGMDVGPAIAAANDMPETPAATEAVAECSLEGAPAELAAALLERERRVSEQEVRLDDRFRALAVAEEELAARLSELREAEASLAAAIAGAETASDTDLGRLVSVYENMKPADAAELFEEMTPNFAAGFIGAMRPDAAAAILAGLDPTSAYAISVVLAGRNAEVPTE